MTPTAVASPQPTISEPPETAVRSHASELVAAHATIAALRAELVRHEAVRYAAESLAHDLHTPLTVVLAATRALTHPSVSMSPKAAELAESAARNARHLSNLLENGLETTHAPEPPHGRTQIVDVAALVCEAAQATSRPVRTRVDEGLTAIGDAGRLRLALERLVRDAGPGCALTAQRVRERIEIAVTVPASENDRGYSARAATYVRHLLAGTGATFTAHPDDNPEDQSFRCATISVPSIDSSVLDGRARWSAPC